MDKPAISVLMSNYNKSKYITEAIKSVLMQGFASWELIIYDDGSTNNLIEVIKEFLSDSRICFIPGNIKLGTANALKKMIEKAVGDIMGILDSDDTLAPDALAEIFKAYEDNPNCGFVYTQCWYCDENLKPVHLGASAVIPEGKSNLHSNSVVALRTFKKEAYLKTTGYDKEILFAEDLDLTLKLEEVTKLFFLDKPLYYYRILPKSQTHSFKNTRINRSSTALAKLNAYERRLGSDIPNLNKSEISEVLFWGILNSLLAGRWQLAKKFCVKLFTINPLAFLQLGFYKLLFFKIKKIVKLKKDKPLLKI